MRGYLAPLMLALVSVSVPALAHEIGTTEVRADFRTDHSYRIDVITAPMSLFPHGTVHASG